MRSKMNNKVVIGGYCQGVTPSCQFRVIEHVGFYDGKHYYNTQILDDKSGLYAL